MENNYLKIIINDDGDLFYSKWRKDTIQGFIIAPFFFSFFALIFIMIVGVSVKLFFILIWPLILTIVLFIYVPYFVRRKYVNNTAREISIENDKIYLETFQWFKYDSIKEYSVINETEIRVSSDISFFKGKKIYVLNFKNSNSKTFYIVSDFFDKIEAVEKLLI